MLKGLDKILNKLFQKMHGQRNIKLFLHVSLPKICMHFCSAIFASHTSLISSSLMCNFTLILFGETYIYPLKMNCFNMRISFAKGHIVTHTCKKRKEKLHRTNAAIWFNKMSRLNHPTSSYINPLKTKRRPLYLKAQFVPRSKHFSSGL
jgi:hypothetical protein